MNSPLPEASVERKAAKDAGLRHVDDGSPGIRRLQSGNGNVRYLDAHGKPLRDAAQLARIASLAIPPAYQDVWICPFANGHLQATGRDARGRKQYRYHPRWREVRDATKFERMQAFGLALPRIRRRVERDLALKGQPRDKVLAAVVRLLETTLIRVGNESYARDNRSFGLTTLRNRHVAISGATLRFTFRGKSGVRHVAHVEDPRLARVVRRCMELPGQELFQYRDETGAQRVIDSADVNAYLRAASGADFTAKDYRTCAGSVMALETLRRNEDGAAPTKKHVVDVIRAIAIRLGNTPAVCRKCYVHPAVLDAYLEQRLSPEIAIRARRGLKIAEAAFLAFLDDLARCVRREARRKRSA